MRNGSAVHTHTSCVAMRCAPCHATQARLNPANRFGLAVCKEHAAWHSSGCGTLESLMSGLSAVKPGEQSFEWFSLDSLVKLAGGVAQAEAACGAKVRRALVASRCGECGS